MSSISDQPLFINQLPVSTEFPKEYEKFHEVISLLYKRIASAVNTKEGSLYSTQEFGNFQLYFTIGNPQVFRNVYRKVVNFGALPNTATKSVAHGIAGIDPGGGNPSTFSFTHIYATASDQSAGAESFIPIPYASPTLANNIELRVDQTNVYITTGSNRSNYTICFVVLEYTKNN